MFELRFGWGVFLLVDSGGVGWDAGFNSVIPDWVFACLSVFTCDVLCGVNF